MPCKNCGSDDIVKHQSATGKTTFLCNNCGYAWSESVVRKSGEEEKVRPRATESKGTSLHTVSDVANGKEDIMPTVAPEPILPQKSIRSGKERKSSGRAHASVRVPVVAKVKDDHLANPLPSPSPQNPVKNSVNVKKLSNAQGMLGNLPLPSFLSPRFIFFMMSAIIIYLGSWLGSQYNGDAFFRNYVNANQSTILLYSTIYFCVFIVVYNLLFGKKSVRNKMIVEELPTEEVEIIPQEGIPIEEETTEEIPTEEVQEVPYRE